MKKLENLQSINSQQDNSHLNKLGVFYEKVLGKAIPRYAFFGLIICLLSDVFVYYSTKQILSFALPIENRINMEIFIDAYIPVSNFWVVIYFLAYVFWAVNIVLASREGKEHWFKCFLSAIIGLSVCFVLFLLVPSTMTRPELQNDGVFYHLMELLYVLDEPSDLFPSIHCLASWFCFAWIRDSKKIHISYKVFSLIFALLICASTMLVKQHCFVDFVAGVVLAELAFFIAQHTNVYKKVMRLFDKLEITVFYKK